MFIGEVIRDDSTVTVAFHATFDVLITLILRITATICLDQSNSKIIGGMAPGNDRQQTEKITGHKIR
ncbi:hypothetical protein D3C76_1796710 [compost metagenome]